MNFLDEILDDPKNNNLPLLGLGGGFDIINFLNGKSDKSMNNDTLDLHGGKGMVSVPLPPGFSP